jgi:hypothetical protein
VGSPRAVLIGGSAKKARKKSEKVSSSSAGIERSAKVLSLSAEQPQR